MGADAGIIKERDAHAFKAFNLGKHHLIRQAVGRYAVAQHPAGFRHGLIHRHSIPFGSHVVRARQSGRPGADNSHLFQVPEHERSLVLFCGKVAHELFQCIDIDGGIHIGAGAFAFTGVKAHSAGDGREWVGAPEVLHCLIHPPLLDQIVVVTDLHPGWAGSHTGRNFLLTGRQPEYVQRACFYACAAPGTCRGIDRVDHAVLLYKRFSARLTFDRPVSGETARIVPVFLSCYFLFTS